MKPTASTTADTTAVTGAAALVLVWTLDQCGVDLPVEVAGAIVLVVSVLGGYFIPRGGGRRASS